jgi:hypothetical protein
MAGGDEQAFDEVVDENGGEEALAAGDFENHAAGDGFENGEEAGIAGTVDHGRTDNHAIRNEGPGDALAFELGTAVIGEWVRDGVFGDRCAIQAGSYGSEAADMHQANRTPLKGTGEGLGGLGVAAIVGGGGKGPGDAGEVDDGSDAIERAIQSLAGDEIAGGGFDAGREEAGDASRTEQATGRLTASGERIEKMASYEAGAASDEDHRGILRKATSPK